MLTALDVSMISMMLYDIRGLDDILKIAKITKYLPAFQVLTLNMLNCFKVYKRYIHIVNPILKFGLNQVDEINETTMNVVCPPQPVLCLLMLWRF